MDKSPWDKLTGMCSVWLQAYIETATISDRLTEHRTKPPEKKPSKTTSDKTPANTQFTRWVHDARSSSQLVEPASSCKRHIKPRYVKTHFLSKHFTGGCFISRKGIGCLWGGGCCWILECRWCRYWSSTRCNLRRFFTRHVSRTICSPVAVYILTHRGTVIHPYTSASQACTPNMTIRKVPRSIKHKQRSSIQYNNSWLASFFLL